jgi:hypothetical protein
MIDASIANDCVHVSFKRRVTTEFPLPQIPQQLEVAFLDDVFKLVSSRPVPFASYGFNYKLKIPQKSTVIAFQPGDDI